MNSFQKKSFKYIDLKFANRKVWKRNNAIRIGVFWIGSVLTLGLVIMIIATDWITWDRLNRDFLASTGWQ